MSLYNLRNPAVKRLMKEAEELRQPTEEYRAQPIEDNLFEWRFTLKGPSNSDYEGGIYHGRITLPTEYPMKPPSIILLTPNGRFETNKKICLNISGHHPETWQPSWSIRTALLAIIGFMPTHGNGAIGSLDYTREERQQLALKSQEFQCPECGYIKDIFSKKPSNTLGGSVPIKESLSNSESNHDGCNNVMPKEEDKQSASETSAAKTNLSNDDETSLVHRRKSPSMQETEVDKKQAKTESNHNFFFSLCVMAIVSIIMFLSVRRLLSL